MECLRQEYLPGQKEEEEEIGKGETTSCELVVRGNWGRNFLFGVCVVVEVGKKNRVLCWMWLLLALFLVYKDLPVMSTGQRILHFKIRFFLFFLPPLPPPASGMHAYKKNESPSLSKTANGRGIP